MGLDNYQIAETFCSHRFAETYPYMVDEITWKVVGRAEHVGREAVIGRCAESAKFLETVTTTSLKLNITRAETSVIVEGAAEFLDQENQTLSGASCDIFRF